MTNNPIISDESEFLIINKQAGILSQGNDSTDESIDQIYRSMYKGYLHVLTRLDRPVGGVMALSKSKKFTKHFNREQNNSGIIKRYFAIVEGRVDPAQGKLIDELVHDTKNHKARITQIQSSKSKTAELSYRLLKHLERYSILEVELNSGKFHQIRAQLAHAGYPIKGDVKYGARRSNRDRTIHLHAHSISFKDLENKEVKFVAPLNTEDNLWKLCEDKT